MPSRRRCQAARDRPRVCTEAIRRVVSGADASRPRAAEALLRNAMDDLNVEFEFQLRRVLRDWLVQVAPGADGTLPAPPPAGVTREELPRS